MSSAILTKTSPSATQSNTTYQIGIAGDELMVCFGDPASNDQIIKDAEARLNELIEAKTLRGGPLLKINGPMSLPVAFGIAHKVAHLFGAIAIYDPKLAGYVVAITHSPTYQLGDILG